MYSSAYDLKAFYNTRTGRVVRRVLKDRIAEIWPDVKNLRLLGCGYATPYLRHYIDEAERVISLMPAGQGAHHWPQTADEKNLVCLSEQSEIPIETNSVDRILMIHDLEYCEFLQPNFEEIWRVLKSNGRLLVVVPNRNGFWSHAEWSPFGQGRPFSTSQLYQSLRDNLFTHERTEEALFMPPIQWSPVLKFASGFERIGKTAFPMVAGVHIVEASKQLYGRVDKGQGAKVKIRGRGIFVPKPAARSSTSYASS